MTETPVPYTIQREIKFRLWDANRKKMVFGPTDDNPQPSWVIVAAESVGAPLMQFTGLKDKNGREIYEGDLIRLADGNVQVVEWFADVSGFEPFVSLLRSDGPIFEVGESEVIGNIHENPEPVK